MSRDEVTRDVGALAGMKANNKGELKLPLGTETT
jgi:hypothetical protein